MINRIGHKEVHHLADIPVLRQCFSEAVRVRGSLISTEMKISEKETHCVQSSVLKEDAGNPSLLNKVASGVLLKS